MSTDDERILNEQLSPHRLVKPAETSEYNDSSDAAAFAIGPSRISQARTISHAIREGFEPDPLREPIARALARRFRAVVREAWSRGVLDTYGPDDVCELLADNVAGMICGIDCTPTERIDP